MDVTLVAKKMMLYLMNCDYCWQASFSDQIFLLNKQTQTVNAEKHV